jgi:hypothetical protein
VIDRRTLLGSLAGLIAALPIVGKAQAEPTTGYAERQALRDQIAVELAEYSALIEHEHERVYWGPHTAVYMDEATAAAWDEIVALYR